MARTVWFVLLMAIWTAPVAAGQSADNPEVLLALARQYAQAGEHDRAISSYERSLALITGSAASGAWKGQEPIIRFNLAMLHAAKGAGLFQADNLEDAISSFRTSLEWNPYSRDNRYNLCQALYVEASRLRDEGAASGDVAALYMDVLSEAGKVRDADPANANLMRLLAYSYRALGEEDRATALLEERAKMPFEVSDIRMDVGGAETTVSGAVRNLALVDGTQVRLRITMVAFSGEPIGAGELQVVARRAGEPAPFSVTIRTSADVAGWRYEAEAK
jgi:tetratricopeptide (TPR) repeat protein